MSILGKIFGRIFPNAHAQQPAPTAQQPSPASAAPKQTQAAPQTQTPSAPQAGTAAAATVERVDIEEVLNGLAAKNPQKLNWRTSIVDLMKLLDIDSNLDNRKELATELGYTGDKDGSAEMNIWLHKAVMRRLGENGGRVPANLTD